MPYPGSGTGPTPALLAAGLGERHVGAWTRDSPLLPGCSLDAGTLLGLCLCFCLGLGEYNVKRIKIVDPEFLLKGLRAFAWGFLP